MRLASFVVTCSIAFVVIRILRFLYSKLSEYHAICQALGKVPSSPAHWLWGHVRKAESNYARMKRMLAEAEKFPILTTRWIGWIGTLQVYFPSSVKTILKTEEPKNPVTYKMIDPWIGDGILLSSGKKWKRNRRLLTQAFHFDMLKGYLLDFNSTSNVLVEKWRKLSKITVFHDVSLMTLDTMMKTAMGADTDCQRIGTRHPYIKAVYDMSNCITDRIFNPYHRRDFIYFNFTSEGKKFTNAAKVAHRESETRIKARQRELENIKLEELTDNGHKINFLDLLILAKDENGKGLSFKEMRDEVDTFLFEGHDTTASGLSWALYNLATHPDYQKRCREEVLQVMGNRDQLTNADLNKLTYLTMCIKESLRLHPPVFGISRQLTQPMKFPLDHKKINPAKETFPSKTIIAINILTLHRNTTVWEDPEVYNPERFTADNVSKRSPFAFIPFSAGPRNCIGQSFAMMEMKVALAKLLKNFKFDVDEDYPPPEMNPLIVLRATEDIHLKVTSI